MRPTPLLALALCSASLAACAHSSPPPATTAGRTPWWNRGAYVGIDENGTQTLFATGTANGLMVNESMARTHADADARAKVAAVIRSAVGQVIDCSSAEKRSASSSTAQGAGGGSASSGGATSTASASANATSGTAEASAVEQCNRQLSQTVDAVLTYVSIPNYQQEFERDTVYAQAAVPLEVVVGRIDQMTRAIQVQVEVEIRQTDTEAAVRGAANAAPH